MAQAHDLTRDVPTLAIEALHAGLGTRLTAVVLFGSRARRDDRPDSDWDLLVIAEGLPEHYFDRQFLVNSFLEVCPYPISPVIRTPKEFESHVPSLYLDIAVDGYILYDPAGYAAGRLAHLRRLIEEAGLSRERTAAGDVWTWEHPPRGPWVMTWERIGKPS